MRITGTSICRIEDSTGKINYITSNIRAGNNIITKNDWYVKYLKTNNVTELLKGTKGRVIKINQNQTFTYSSQIDKILIVQMDLLIELKDGTQCYIPSPVCNRIDTTYFQNLAR